MAPPPTSADSAVHERLTRLAERRFGARGVPPEVRAFLDSLSGELDEGDDGPPLPAADADPFRELAEHVGTATFIYRGSRLLFVNRAAAELTGYPREALLGMEFWAVVHPDARELVRQRGLARQRGEAIPARYEFPIIRRDGEVRWVDFSAGAVTYAGEAAVLGTAIDVTASRRAREALERQALAFENLYDALIISDEQGRITDWNPAAERTYGFTRDEVLGRTATDLGIHGERMGLEEEMVRALEEEGRWQGEVRFTRKDGSPGVSETVVLALRDARGHRIGALGVNRDVSERKRAEEALRASEERFRLMLSGTQQLFFYVHDLDGVYESLSPSVRDVLGYGPDELVGKPYGLLHTAHAANGRVAEQTRRTVEDGTPNTYIVYTRHREGHVVALELVETVVRRAGRVRAVQGFARNVTERIRAEEALRESEERYRTLFEESRDAVYMSNVDGGLVSANQAFLELFGIERAALETLRLEDLYLRPADRQRFRDEIFRAGFVRDHEVTLRRADGTELHCLVSSTLRRRPDGTVTGYQGIIHDISERKRVEEQLVYGALHDALTGLPNRALFVDRLTQALERVRRGGEPAFAVLFLDLDRFKVVNDSLGHGVGDQMLVAIAGRLQEALPPGGTVARFGGDEFTVLLNEVGTALEATHVADRILQALAEPFSLVRHEVFATASVGIAVSTTGAESPEVLLRNADAALSRAKALGKNRYEVFDRGMHAEAIERLQLETDLRRALERGELLLHYQPIVRLSDGMIAGFEALLRWQHPERGWISPTVFVPVAEEMGLIHALGRWVIDTACAQGKTWTDRFPDRPLRLSLNLSAAQFSQADLAEHVERTMRDCGIGRGVLHFEITESVILDHAEPGRSILEHLRELGIVLCMDDFGTGYSSLGYLHRFPIDELKIDRSFITRMEQDARNSQLVQAIVGLARNLSVEVVAEGVETRDQLAALRALECDYAQGFLFSVPLPAEEAEALLRSDPRW